jgi:hypothetical protein
MSLPCYQVPFSSSTVKNNLVVRKRISHTKLCNFIMLKLWNKSHGLIMSPSSYFISPSSILAIMFTQMPIMITCFSDKRFDLVDISQRGGREIHQYAEDWESLSTLLPPSHGISLHDLCTPLFSNEYSGILFILPAP